MVQGEVVGSKSLVKVNSQRLKLESETNSCKVVQHVFAGIGGEGGMILFVGVEYGVADVSVLDFVAGGQYNGESVVEIDAHTDARFAVRAVFGAVYYSVHRFWHGGDIPFEAVSCVEVEQGFYSGVGEIHREIQIYRDEGSVFPNVEASPQS